MGVQGDERRSTGTIRKKHVVLDFSWLASTRCVSARLYMQDSHSSSHVIHIHRKRGMRCLGIPVEPDEQG